MARKKDKNVITSFSSNNMNKTTKPDSNRKKKGKAASKPSSRLRGESAKERSKSLTVGSSMSNDRTLDAHSQHQIFLQYLNHPTIKSSTLIPIPPKLLKRFYEALLILSMLGRNRGDKVEEERYETELDPDELNPDRLRDLSSVIWRICVIMRKGGILPGPLGWRKHRGVSYIASPRTDAVVGESDTIKLFLEDILGILGRSGVDGSDVERVIFEKSVGFSRERIHVYAKKSKGDIRVVWNDLSGQQIDEDIALSD